MCVLASGCSAGDGAAPPPLAQSAQSVSTWLDDCKLDELPPPIDVCRTGRPLPTKAGTTGQYSFAMPEDGQLCVRARGKVVASAQLDGASLDPLGDKGDPLLEAKTLTKAGAHTITVRDPKGTPTKPDEVQVLFARAPAAGEKSAREALAALHQSACLERKAGNALIDDDILRDVGLDPGRVATVPGKNGVPTRLWPLPKDATTPEDWLAKHAAVVGVDPKALLADGVRKLTDGAEVHVFAQTVDQKIPVYPGELALTMRDGRPWSLRAHVLPTWRLPRALDPKLDPKKAGVLAREIAGADHTVTGTALVVFDRATVLGRGDAVLAWAVGLRRASGKAQRVWLDAVTGALVHRAEAHLDEPWDARATVDAIDGEVCVSGGEDESLVTASTRVYDTVSSPVQANCPGNRRCATQAEAADATFRMLLSTGRLGWGGWGAAAFTDPLGIESAEAIAPNAPFRMFTESTSPAGAFWRRTQHTANFTSELDSRDVVAHEFGHALHQAARGNRPPLPRPTALGLGEAYGDTQALMVQSMLGGSALTAKMLDSHFRTIRDYTAEKCTGYGPGETCDFAMPTAATACGTSTYLSGCAEYTHMDWFPDEDLEIGAAKGRARPHLLGCALARPYATLLDPTIPAFRRGAWIHNLHAPSVRRMWLHQMEHGATDSSLQEIELSYREAAAEIGTRCRRGASYCAPGVDAQRIAMEAFYANGHFSGAQSLADRAPTGDYGGVSTGVAAAVAYDPTGPQVWLLYGAGSNSTLRLARIDDPLGGGTLPASVPLRVSGAEVRLGGDPAISFDDDPEQGVMWIAYHERDTHRLRVAHYNLTGNFSLDARFSATIEGAPGLYAHGGKVWVAYKDRVTGLVHVQHAGESDATAITQVAPAASTLEHDPSFYVASWSAHPYLLTMAGPTRVCDSIVTSDCEDDAQGHVVRVWTGSALSSPGALTRLPLPYGFGSSLEDQEGANGQYVLGFLNGVGSAATTFLNRVFVFTPSFTVGEFSDGTALAWSYSWTGDEPHGRTVGVPIGSVTRLAPVYFSDPARGDALLVFGANGSIQMTVRRAM